MRTLLGCRADKRNAVVPSGWSACLSNRAVVLAFFALACSSCMHKPTLVAAYSPTQRVAAAKTRSAFRAAAVVGDIRQRAAERISMLTPLSALPTAIPVSGLRWQWLGPTSLNVPTDWWDGVSSPGWKWAGRTNGLAIDPHDDKTVYAATSGGGLWRTVDGGQNWVPLTDSQCSLHTSSIAVDPIESKTLYLGTGDPDTARRGCGLLKSADGGATWKTMLPFDVVRRIVAINTAAGTVLLVAADNGIYRSTDGAVSAPAVLNPFPGLSWGADVAVAPGSQRLYASANISDTDVALFRSDDSGNTWKEVHDFDSGEGVLKLALTVSPTSADTIAVLVVRSATEVEVQRSTDGGRTFVPIFSQSDTITIQGVGYSLSLPGGPGCRSQCNYDSVLSFDALDADTIYVGLVSVFRTRDDGKNWTDIMEDQNAPTNGRAVHPDIHAFTFDSQGRLYIGCDGGVFRSTGFGTSHEALNGNLGNLEFYDVTVGPTDPDSVIGGTQDNGAPERDGNTWADFWVPGDAFQVFLQSHVDQQVLLADTSARPWVRRINVPPTSTNPLGEPAADGLPTDLEGSISPRDAFSRPGTLYYVSDKLYRTVDDGTSWHPISPTLGTWTVFGARPAPSSRGRVVYALALDKDWNMSLYRTVDGGVNWTEITPGGTFSLLALPTNTPNTILSASPIVVDPFDPDHVFIANGNVFESQDGGQTWSQIGSEFSAFGITISADTFPPRVLIVTNVGVLSYKGNGSWEAVLSGMPNIAPNTLEFQPATGYLFASTFGRGVFRVRLLDPTIAQEGAPVITSIVGAALSSPSVTALAPNGLATIFASNLVPPGYSHGVSSTDMTYEHLPVRLNGVCVTINGVPAPLIGVYSGSASGTADQVNFQVPSVQSVGEALVSAGRNCGSSGQSLSAGVTAPYQLSAPEFFYFQNSAGGQNPVAAIDARSGALIGPVGLVSGATFTPAAPGETISIFGTGFGLTNGLPYEGELLSVADPVSAPFQLTLDGNPLPGEDVLYVGATPGYVGLYQVNVTVPSDTPDGNHVIAIQINGISSPEGSLAVKHN